MKYRHDVHNKEWFLSDPRSRKWIVQCVGCQEYGRSPDAPSQNHARYNFEYNFQIMQLNENGLCEVCQSLTK